MQLVKLDKPCVCFMCQGDIAADTWHYAKTFGVGQGPVAGVSLQTYRVCPGCWAKAEAEEKRRANQPPK